MAQLNSIFSINRRGVVAGCRCNENQRAFSGLKVCQFRFSFQPPAHCGSGGADVKLWLVRHAQPLIAPGICYGATDVVADEAQTLQTAHVLAQVLPSGLLLISSTLQRCELLAQCLRGLRPDLSYRSDARLIEMDFGCWEGRRWDAIPQPDLDRWVADFGRHRFGGRESVQAFMQRVAGAWDETRLGRQDTVWITHAGVIRAATLLARGVRQVTQASQWPKEAPAFGQWCEVQG